VLGAGARVCRGGRGNEGEGEWVMTSGDETQGAVFGLGPLQTRALAREAGRARGFLAAGEWCPAAADCEAAAAVLGRLVAPLPARRAATVRTLATDRDRRLQRLLRTTLYHLDAGTVSPPAAALLAAVARAFLPWYATPNPPAAAAAPRYGTPAGTAEGLAVPPMASSRHSRNSVSSLSRGTGGVPLMVTVPAVGGCGLLPMRHRRRGCWAGLRGMSGRLCRFTGV